MDSDSRSCRKVVTYVTSLAITHIGRYSQRAGRAAGVAPDCSSLLLDRPLGRQILESDTAPAPEPLARLYYSPQKLGMVLQPIVEPVLLAFEANQHAGRFTMPCDEDFLRLGQA